MKKTKMRIISILLGFCMLFGMIPSVGLTAFAQDAAPSADTWDNHAADDFAGGAGTQDDPYQIANAEQLAKLAKDVNIIGGEYCYENTYFVLTADIDLSAYRWIPIGVYAEGISNTRFSGCLNGQNYTISGLYVDERESGLSAGLFGSIGATDENTLPPTVKNLTIADAKIYASDDMPEYNENWLGYAGILTGVTTQYVYTTVIENVHVSGTIYTTSVNNLGVYCGGMVGCGYNLKATNCSADVIISGELCVNSGGFIGFAVGGEFENCTAEGEMTGKWGLGGFVGESYNGDPYPDGSSKIIDTKFYKCTASVDITAEDWNAGGFVGYLGQGTISNCASYGNVKSTVTEWEPRIGGFVGSNYGTIQNSHSASTVTENNENYEAGGFVGNDGGGTTTGCFFDNTKNAALQAIGGSESEGQNDITGVPTSTLLGNICIDILGGHSMTHYDAADATCTQEGNVEYWHCSVCNNNYDSESGGNVIDNVVIPKIDHSFGTEWKFNEDKHWHECACGEKAFEAAHTFVWVTDKEAQVGAAGSKHEECTVCGYKKAAVEIPAVQEFFPVVEVSGGGKVEVDNSNPKPGDKVTIRPKPDDGKQVGKIVITDKDGNKIPVTDNGDGSFSFIQPDNGAVTIKVEFETKSNTKPGDSHNPQTGDNSNMWLWIALLFITGVSLTGVVVTYKKRRTAR